jgi:hypothetical protein
MPRERAPIEELRLHSSPSNLKKALKLRARNPDGSPLAKREEVEQLFEDVKAEYAIASDDVRMRGQVLQVTRYTAKGDAYQIEKINPSFSIMRALLNQMSSLARQLAKMEQPRKANDVVPGSVEDLYPELFKEQAS